MPSKKAIKLCTIQESIRFQLNDNQSIAESLNIHLHEENPPQEGKAHFNSLGPRPSRFSFAKDSGESKYPVSDLVRLFTTKTIINIQEAQDEQVKTNTELNLRTLD